MWYSSALMKDFSTSRDCDELVWGLKRSFVCCSIESAVAVPFSSRIGRKTTAESGEQEKEYLMISETEQLLASCTVCDLWVARSNEYRNLAGRTRGRVRSMRVRSLRVHSIWKFNTFLTCEVVRRPYYDLATISTTCPERNLASLLTSWTFVLVTQRWGTT